MWASYSDFLAMGGYGLFVWGSLGMCAAVMAVEITVLKTRRLALLRETADTDTDEATA